MNARRCALIATALLLGVVGLSSPASASTTPAASIAVGETSPAATNDDGLTGRPASPAANTPPDHCTFDYSGTYGPDPIRQGIARLYLALFRRTPDTAGLDYWVNVVSSGATVGELRIWFQSSAEFSSIYAQLSDSQYVARLYDNVLCRTAEAGAADYWANLLNDESLDRSSLIELIFDSGEYATRSS